jgi:Ca-activated chloride channel family protein
MRFSTLGLVTALGMTLTSVSVWAFVPVGDAEAGEGWSEPEAPVTSDSGGGETSDAFASLLDLPSGTFTAGETIQVEGRLGHPVVASGRDAESFLFLDLQAQAGELASTPAPVHLSVVVDRSRSMQGKRLDNALAAARGMIRRLRVGDTVSVVAYNTGTETLVAPTVIDERTRQDALFGLRSVEATGHTCISCGIEEGMRQLSRQRSAVGTTGAVSRMLLLSDGEANTGIRDVEGFRRLAGQARGMDTSISSIGVDVDYNERVMFAVAQSSNGRHYFVENPAGLPRIFDDELQSLVRTVASNAQVEIDLAPGVSVSQVFDRAFTRDGNRLVVPMGSFTAGDQKTLLVKVRMARAEAGRRPVADVRLRYRDLVSGEDGTCEGKLAARVTENASEVAPLDPVVETRLARAETALALTTANDLFRNGDVAGAQRTLTESRTRIRSRKRASGSRASARQRDKLFDDFEQQLDALGQANNEFEEAAAEAPQPEAAPRSRRGKASVRQNAQRLNPFVE